MNRCAGYEVRINEAGFITGVWAGGEWCGVYKWDKRLHCWNNVLPLTPAALRSGIYSGRYEVK